MNTNSTLRNPVLDQFLLTFFPLGKISIIIAWVAILVSMYSRYNLYSTHAVYESINAALFGPLYLGIYAFLVASTVLFIYAGRRVKIFRDEQVASV